MVEVSPAFQRRMQVIPSLIAAEVKPVMEACAEELVALMKTLAPKDTGALAAAIKWTWGNAPDGSLSLDTVSASQGAARIVIYVDNEQTKAAMRGQNWKWRSLSHIKPGAFQIFVKKGYEGSYARFQEFGTKNMPAHPFFFPAYRAKKKEIRRRIAAAVRKGIAKANI